MDLYSAVILITMLFLLITVTDISANRLVTKATKHRAVITTLLIAVSALGECVGVLTNGAAAFLLFPHKIAKAVEFSVAPATGVAAAIAYGDPKKPKLAMALVLAHAVFEWIGVHFEWVFSVDAGNVYHREGLYGVYVVMFILSVAYCFISIIRGGKAYQIGIDGVLVLTLLMLAVGIGMQFVFSGIRIDYLCISMGNMLFYIRHYKIMLQVDAVTGLLNRRCYDVNITDIGSRAVVLLFDIDKFKQVNDTYGHSTGDACLRKVAQQLFSIYGKCGLCYRVGGDEFCVILQENIEQTEEMNRRFAAAIEQLREEDGSMPGVSVGYAYYDEATAHIQNVVGEADAMLYHNKNG